MSSLIGFSSLVLSTFISVIIIFPYLNSYFSKGIIIIAYRTSTFLISFSFLCLIFAYVTSDFSNFNVFQNSHSNKPLIYKISGAWGNHEGSILLWTSLISIFGFIYSFSNKNNSEFKITVLKIQSTLFVLFSSFIIFTSNPFLINSILVTEGLGLNPILQDPSLAIHPPLLYLGFVGFSLVFSLSITTLIKQDFTQNWIIETKKWAIVSWVFLTAGITLGSYWAYYELGWGGWWFWDPVENISLMPWITGLALVHSLLMLREENAIKKWVIFLSILCFSLSIFGTFLVRSGVLTSVHSFASDASRGLFILLIFFLTTGFGLVVFLIKSPTTKRELNIMLINKTSALIINNILMVITVLTILLGTIYPIIIEVLTNSRVSVGGPYFNSTVLPILLPGFLIMSVAPALSWNSNRIKKFKVYVLAFLCLSFFILIQSFFTNFNTWGFLGTLLSLWIIIGSLISIILNYKFIYSFKYIKIINSYIAHIGVGIAILGMTFSSVYQKENNYNVKVGEEIKINNSIIKLENIIIKEKVNYQSLRGLFTIRENQKKVGNIKAGKNYYYVTKMITTEAGIHHDWLKDIYIILGNEDNGVWTVKIYENPLVSFIWLGILIMIFSGLISFFKNE
tara:strand:- start:36677 stop:38545 length:1869 start_codon:yes stop_codon:yes gene_type:complete